MRRSWIAIVCLSGSWLFGLGYYHAPTVWLWALALTAGTGLLVGTGRMKIRRPFARSSTG